MGLTGERWKQDGVSELDSALNKWLDTVPDHRECRTYQARNISSNL